MSLGYTTASEAVTAWRMWRVLPFQRLDGSLSYRLCAAGTLGMPKVWEPRQPTVAVCSSYNSGHEAPWPEHECGMWALKRPERARRRMVTWMWKYNSGEAIGFAWGRVSLWGRLIEHTDGYRAQYAYPFAIEVECEDEGVAAELRRAYIIDVEWNGPDLSTKAAAKRSENARKALGVNQKLREARQHLAANRLGKASAKMDEAERMLAGQDHTPKVCWVFGNRVTERVMLEAVTQAVSWAHRPVTSREVGGILARSFGEVCDVRESGVIGQGLWRMATSGKVRQLRRPGYSARWLPGGSKLPPEKDWTEVNVRTNEAAVLPPHDPEQLLAALRQAIEEEMQKHPRRRKWSGWARGGAVARIICPGATHIHASEIGLRLRKLAEQGLVRGEKDGYSVSNYWQPA